MLPILPALLLLFLQGPANLERLAHEGRFPSALEAVHRMDARDDESLAALLATNTSELSSAILALFRWSEAKSERPANEPIETPVVIETRESEATRDGFKTCQRSRDGQFASA